MKRAFRATTALLLIGATCSAHAVTEVGVDPAQPWYGWMNRWDRPVDGGAYAGGEFWGVPDLIADFSGATLSLKPNTNIDRDAPTDPYWWTPEGESNKILGAQVAVLVAATPGETLVFSGSVLANTLDGAYASSAMVIAYDAAYGYLGQVSAPLVGGQPFSVHYTPVAGVAYLAYGFDTLGPAARVGQSLGAVVITAVPEPSNWAMLGVGLLAVAAARRRTAAA